MMAFMAMHGVFALYLERVFGITVETIGWFFVYVGGASLLMRTLVLGPAIRRFGELRLLRLGTVAMALGLATIPLARNLWEMALAVLLLPVGTALLFPVTTSLVSNRGQADETGLLLGVQQAFGGIARMVGPLWAGVAFQHLGIRSPFWLAAGLMVAVRLLAGVVRGDDPHGADGDEAKSFLAD
jgi:predicted MFS family arabinose efflux permease